MHPGILVAKRYADEVIATMMPVPKDGLKKLLLKWYVRAGHEIQMPVLKQ